MIAINAKAAFHSPRTGLEEYAYQLIIHLIREAKKRKLEKYLLLYAPRWTLMPQEFLNVPIKVLRAPYAWTQGRVAAQLLWDSPDVFFNPEQVLPFFAPKRSVITVHDLAYELYPHYYPFKHRLYLGGVTRHAVKKAKKIIAVSERTKRDVAKLYGVPQRNIHVVYHGFNLPRETTLTDKRGEITSMFPETREPFFLFVGRIEYKKNIITLIESFELFCRRVNKNYRLLLVGAPGFGFSQIKKHIKASPYNKNISLLGYVDASLRNELYKRASAVMLISWYEGFGLPALEAQSFGVPIIASNTSSLPEVVGEGGCLVNPSDPEEIALKMIEVVDHPKIRSYLIKKGYENMERFSWEKCAKETLDILLSV